MFRQFTSEKYAGIFEYGGTWSGAYLLRRAQRMPWDLQGAEAMDVDFVEAGLERLALRGAVDEARIASIGSDRAIVSSLEVTRYMRDRLLRDADWAGMAHSMELRVPFVDAVLARHVASRFARADAYTKRDLAKVARPQLPSEIIDRPKTGFTVPVRDWMMQADPRSVSARGLRAWQSTVASAFAS